MVVDVDHIGLPITLVFAFFYLQTMQGQEARGEKYISFT